MFLDRFDRGGAGVRLGVEIEGRALLRHPPVIKHPRNMPDLFRLDLFDAAQDKIVILGTFEAGAEADFLDQLRSENAEMGEKILGEEEGRIPIGFEMGVTASAHDVEFILVAVEQPRFRMLVDFEGDEIECGGREDIVVVEEGDKFALSLGQARHSRRRRFRRSFRGSAP